MIDWFFPEGVIGYVNLIKRVVPLKFGKTTTLDIGCGVSFIEIIFIINIIFIFNKLWLLTIEK